MLECGTTFIIHYRVVVWWFLLRACVENCTGSIFALRSIHFFYCVHNAICWWFGSGTCLQGCSGSIYARLFIVSSRFLLQTLISRKLNCAAHFCRFGILFGSYAQGCQLGDARPVPLSSFGSSPCRRWFYSLSKTCDATRIILSIAKNVCKV